ncbi:MAG: long-chain fatty acid--CoA ligase [Deltaproteobacteria bacterium]|nr:MAG: long-chain fatty acid--CoA ligase [Deltaproteobacteria bacterium]
MAFRVGIWCHGARLPPRRTGRPARRRNEPRGPLAPMTTRDARTIFDLALVHANAKGAATAALVKRGGTYVPVSWNTLVDDAYAHARGLLGLGIAPEERVAIISHTRIEWTVLDLAIQAAGAVSVPIYPSNLPEDCAYMADHSDAKYVITEDRAQTEKFLSVRDRLPKVEGLFQIEGDVPDDPWVRPISALVDAGKDVSREAVDERRAGVERDQMFTIIYTSGTTGVPKGVVLTHGNVLYEAEAVHQIDLARPDDIQFFFLPLAHVFARVLQVAWLSQGHVMAYAESMQTIKDNIQETRPTIMAGVPRVYEKFYAAVVEQGESAPGLPGKLFREARRLSEKRGNAEWGGPPLTLAERIEWRILERVVFGKVGAKLQAALGGRMRAMLSGGAPLSRTIAYFFRDAGIPILEGYGLTETSAGSCVNRPDAYKIGTVGPPLPGTEVRIAEDGEILIRGPGVMKCYWKAPEETAAVLEPDGWFHTGDIGEIDAEGFLRITDRKKDLIVTAGGKNVAPQKIENLIAGDPLIARCIVFGDRRKYLSALVTLDPEALASFAKERGLSGTLAELAHHPEVERHVADVIAKANAKLASFETIKRWTILDRDLTIEDGELTPKLSVKRKVVEERYKDLIDAMYDESVPT